MLRIFSDPLISVASTKRVGFSLIQPISWGIGCDSWGKDVRLLFSGLDFDQKHEESQRALDSLQKYISMAKTAGSDGEG